MSEQPTVSEQSRTKRRWWRPVLYAAAVLLAVLVAPPWAVQQVLEHWLLANGADRVRIADVDLNLFAGTAAVKGMRVEMQEREVMAVESLSVKVSLLPLVFRQELIVHVGQLDAVRLEIERLPQKTWRIGSVRTGGEVGGEAQRTSGPSWLVRIDQLDVRDSVVRYIGLAMTSTIAVDSASLEAFSSAPTQTPASFVFKGKIDDSPAELDIHELRLHPRVVLAGEVKLQKLPLGRLAGLLGAKPDHLGGRLDAAGDLQINEAHQEGTAMTYDGTLALRGGKAQGKSLRLDMDKLAWQGRVNYARDTQQAPWGLELDGRMTGAEVQLGVAGGSIRASQREIELKGKFAAPRFKERSNFTAQASLRAAGTTLWDTRTDVPVFSLDTIAVGNLEAASAELITVNDLEAQGLRWSPEPSGKTSATLRRLGSKQTRIRGLKTLEVGKMSATGMQLSTVDRSVLLLGAEQLELDGVTAEGSQRVRVGQIDVRGLDALAKPQADVGPIASLGGAQITELAWQPDEGINMAAVQLRDLQARLRREADDRWEIDQLLEGGTAPPQQGETNTQTTPTGDRAEIEPRVRVGELLLIGNNRIRLEDQAVRPPFTSEGVITELRATGIDTQRPGVVNSIVLNGGVGRYGKIRLTGTARPSLPDPESEVKFSTVDLELVPLSSYTVPLFGYAMTRGQLNIDSTTRIAKGQIDSQNQLRLEKPKIEVDSPELATQFDKDIGIRLERALSLLSDKQGNVKLNVPIVGKLGEVRVELEDVINTAVRGALSSGLSALGFVLLPQLSFGKGLIRELTQKKMAPIEFAAGSTELSKAHRKAIHDVVTRLKEETRTVQLCPVITIADVGALFGETVRDDLLRDEEAGLSAQQEDELIALGYERAVAIKDRLVVDEGIAPGWIFTCAPQADEKAKAKPRVELRF